MTTEQTKPEAPANQYVKSITVDALRIGHSIPTKWKRGLEGIVALKSEKVQSIDECPGQWRTHIHVNKTKCYDTRAQVYVVTE